MSRRKIQVTHHHKLSSISRVPSPIMMSQARWVTFTSEVVGSSSVGIVFRPWTTVEVPVLGSDRIEARPGIGMPPTTW